MKNCAQYIALGKNAVGERGQLVSDKKLGETLGGYAQSTIAEAKAGRMSDGIALALGKLLEKHKLIDHAGEVMLVAHAERKTGIARATLLDYAKNVVGRLPQRVLSLFAGLTLAGGLTLCPHDADASVGGAGGLRP